MKSVQTVLALLSLVALTFTAGLGVRDAVAGDNLTDISGQALSGAIGMVGINMAAGDDNVQVNARVIAIGDGAPVFSNIGVDQRVNTKSTLESPSSHLDYIGGEAFAGSRGMISINQTAGSGTAQANLVSIGLGAGNATLVSSDQLLISHGDREVNPRGYKGTRSDVIDGHAFAGCQGLVQVNQSAGSANRVLNTVAIRFKTINIQ